MKEKRTKKDQDEKIKELTEKLGSRLQLVGDDLFVTNEKRLRQGIDLKAANATAKATATIVGAAMPQIQPMAMPVKAECPSASEKKLILPVTIMVEVKPNKGAIKITASNAFRIKFH